MTSEPKQNKTFYSLKNLLIIFSKKLHFNRDFYTQHLHMPRKLRSIDPRQCRGSHWNCVDIREKTQNLRLRRQFHCTD